MTRGKKKREIAGLFETNCGYFAEGEGVRRRQTNGRGAPRGCILRLVNGGGRLGRVVSPTSSRIDPTAV